MFKNNFKFFLLLSFLTLISIVELKSCPPGYYVLKSNDQKEIKSDNSVNTENTKDSSIVIKQNPAIIEKVEQNENQIKSTTNSTNIKTDSSSEDLNCIPCPLGHYTSKSNSESCIPCSKGYITLFDSGSNVKCFQCPLGQTTEKEGSITCIECPPGTIGFWEDEDAKRLEEEEKRKKNRFQREMKENVPPKGDGCIPCKAGTFQDTKRTPQGVAKRDKNKKAYTRICKRCPTGTISPQDGMNKCIPCEKGYTANWKKTECVKSDL